MKSINHLIASKRCVEKVERRAVKQAAGKQTKLVMIRDMSITRIEYQAQLYPELFLSICFEQLEVSGLSELSDLTRIGSLDRSHDAWGNHVDANHTMTTPMPCGFRLCLVRIPLKGCLHLIVHLNAQVRGLCCNYHECLKEFSRPL